MSRSRLATFISGWPQDVVTMPTETMAVVLGTEGVVVMEIVFAKKTATTSHSSALSAVHTSTETTLIKTSGSAVFSGGDRYQTCSF